MPFARHHRSRAIASALLAGSLFAQTAGARTTNDTYVGKLWHLDKIRAGEAWDSSLGFEGVTVAIIDSGVDIGHPDLKDNIWRNPGEVAGNGVDDDGNGYVDDVHGWDFVDDDNDPRPTLSGGFSTLGVNHGTIDAGIVAAKGDNAKGIVGVSWQTTIMPIRVLGSNGFGDPIDVVRAVEYAVRSGAKIVNLSFAGPVLRDDLAIALRRAYDAGVFVVAAAGNAPEGKDAVDLDATPLYPVCTDAGADENFIYGVAATDMQDRLAPFSDFGAGCVDISAPGARMLSSQFYVPGDKLFGEPYGGYYNGTSLAAAVVSGTVSLMYALDRNLTPKQVMNILTETSVKVDGLNPGYFGKMGRGRIDAAAAVRRVIENGRSSKGESGVSTADLLPKGASLIAAAPATARKGDVRLFTADGTFVRSFLAFPAAFTGGVGLSAADFDRTGKHTIVAAAGPGGSPQIRIFDVNTRAIGGFFAYDQGFRGGVRAVAADVDGDGRDEIVTGAGKGGGPHIRVFTPAGVATGGFFAFDAKRRAGVLLAAADLDGDGKAEIVAAEPGGLEVRVFSGPGKRLASFAVPAARDLSVIDVTGDGKAEIVVRSVVRGVPTAIAYDALGARVISFDPQTFAVVNRVPGEPTSVRPRGAVFGALSGFAPTVIAATALGSPAGFASFESVFRGGVSAIRLE